MVPEERGAQGSSGPSAAPESSQRRETGMPVGEHEMPPRPALRSLTTVGPEPCAQLAESTRTDPAARSASDAARAGLGIFAEEDGRFRLTMLAECWCERRAAAFSHGVRPGRRV